MYLEKARGPGPCLRSLQCLELRQGKQSSPKRRVGKSSQEEGGKPAVCSHRSYTELNSAPQIHVHLESQNVTIFGNMVSARAVS